MLVRSALWHDGCGRVADAAQGEAECLYCATRPQPKWHKSRKARTHQHYMVYCCSEADIEQCADIRRCLLTVSADITQSIWRIQHALDYMIYGWGGAFDVTHEVTIIFGIEGAEYCNVIMNFYTSVTTNISIPFSHTQQNFHYQFKPPSHLPLLVLQLLCWNSHHALFSCFL